MIFRLFLLVFLTLSLSAEETSWYDKIETKIEAGLSVVDLDGTMVNPTSYTYFVDDFDYVNSTYSYFRTDFKFDYDYMPNLDLSYSNMRQFHRVRVDRPFEVAKVVFDTTVNTKIDHTVFNAVIYKTLKQKGKMVPFLRWKFYTGDIEYGIGINVKHVLFRFQVRDSLSEGTPYTYVQVRDFIPLPHFRFKYYRYNWIVYGDVSALSVAQAKAMSYQIGVDYQIINNLYLSTSYIYEDFSAIEKRDEIKFSSAGNKFSFKYVF